MSEQQGDGATLRDHLQRLARNTGKMDPRLVHVEPAAGQALLQAWRDMSVSRRSGMQVQPITLVDIDAWCRLQRVQLTPWEVDTITKMDDAALAAAARLQAARSH